MVSGSCSRTGPRSSGAPSWTRRNNRPTERFIVFPEDTSRWREDSRTIRAARPNQHGEFSIKGLPAGKYLIAAVDYLQEGQWYDPEFLVEVRPCAERLSLTEAESKRIDLTVKK